MNDVVLGLVLLAVGFALTFWGASVLRALLALGGAFVGFFLGAELVQDSAGGELLGTFWGWAAAIVGAVLLGLLAYAWYWLGVVLWVAAMGYVLGVVIAGAFGAERDWVLVTVGLGVALVLVVLAMALRLPALLLIIISASSGASLVITSVMLFFGEINGGQLDRAFTIAEPSWLWYGAALVLFVVGVVAQLQLTARRTAVGVDG